MSIAQDSNALSALAADHGLDIEPGSIVFYNAGLDFLVAFAKSKDGREWVLRLPRRKEVIEKSKYEARVLNLVSRHLPVEVPKWQIHSDDFIAYTKLRGTPGLTINPETKEPIWHFDQNSNVYPDTLGKALAALHNIDPQEAKAAGITVLSPEEVRARHLQNMTKVRSELGVSQTLWEQWQSWLGDDSYWPNFSALVHGDLYAAHVIMDENARATGIIDWTEAIVGDPGTDFIFHLMGFGEAGYQRLVDSYVQAGGRTWPRMKEHCQQLLSAFTVNYALYALLTQDEQHIAAAKVGLGVSENTSSPKP